jgi:methylenetetrahydrofolate dehydrogenase (NADP+)/methenyltetrahydrofolate cyclohydrolase
MPAILLDGKALSRTIQEELAVEVAGFVQLRGIVPCLAAVLAGDNPASEIYVRNKRQACERTGMSSQLHRLPADVSQDDLLGLIRRLNSESAVHGILVQLPLPPQIDERLVLQSVSPLKDVDAFHPENVGRIVQGKPRFLPCTPQGVREVLVRNSLEIAGRHVVIVGRSDIVGKPLANMLVQRGVDATVTVCHSRTENLPEITRLGQILVVAIGRPKFVTASMVRPGAVVIDVGINRTEDGIVGDVDFESVREVASFLTPVPGGVGPLTIAMLLKNTLTAAKELS